MWFPYFFFSLYNFYICNSWVRLCCCAACHSIRYMNSNVADLVSGSTKTIARWSVYVWKKKIIEKKILHSRQQKQQAAENRKRDFENIYWCMVCLTIYCASVLMHASSSPHAYHGGIEVFGFSFLRWRTSTAYKLDRCKAGARKTAHTWYKQLMAPL